MPSVCRRRTPQQYPSLIKGYYSAVMTDCLAVVAGNFDQVGDKPPCNASNSITNR